MNTALVAAGVLTIVIGIVHSALGESMIFRRMRSGTIVPTIGHPLLRERHVRILWATWHVVTIFGLGFAAILFHAATQDHTTLISPFVLRAIVISTAAAGALVMYATKGMHPGWAGLLFVALLIWIA